MKISIWDVEFPVKNEIPEDDWRNLDSIGE